MEQNRLIVHPPFKPSLAQYKRSVRFEDLDDAQDDALALYNKAQEILQPKFLICERFITAHSVIDGLPSITVDGVVFRGKALRVLDDIHRVFAYVATCGDELESLDVSDMDMLAPYWVDAIKEQGLRDARVALMAHCRANYGISRPKSLNPGSGNVDIWPIEEQRGLFTVLGGSHDIGVTLTESFLMLPNKSISGFIFASPTVDYESCAYCEKERCPNRRVPFKERM
ncbi:MAG: vitamin B12 dependent-methionine synthase activation domain-containing protein [Sphaerochaeta sp.]|nr:vitamin B12 dependent-methionine synthase activation domain-containing protein [Sphaerochaeta sp.]